MDVRSILEKLPASDFERASYLLDDLRKIPADHRPTSFLDMGAGSGSMAAVVCLMFPGISGVLVDAISRLTLINQLPIETQARLSFLQWPCETELNGRGFDLVLSIDVLEHIPDWKSALKQLTSHVAPEAYLYLQTPSAYPSPNWPTATIYWQRILGLFGMSDPSKHVRHGLSCKELLDEVGQAFLPIVASESYIVNGRCHCAFKPRTHLLLKRSSETEIGT